MTRSRIYPFKKSITGLFDASPRRAGGNKHSQQIATGFCAVAALRAEAYLPIQNSLVGLFVVAALRAGAFTVSDWCKQEKRCEAFLWIDVEIGRALGSLCFSYRRVIYSVAVLRRVGGNTYRSGVGRSCRDYIIAATKSARETLCQMSSKLS